MRDVQIAVGRELERLHAADPVSSPMGVRFFEGSDLVVPQSQLNLHLLYPALALAAFVGWKAVWLIVERRRERATPG